MAVGLTTKLVPETGPTPESILKLVAPATDQDNVEFPPLMMVDGFAVNSPMTGGLGMGAGVSPPPPPQATESRPTAKAHGNRENKLWRLNSTSEKKFCCRNVFTIPVVPTRN